MGIDTGDQPPIDVAILTWEWGKYLGDAEAEKGARLKISSYIRPHVNSYMTKAKITGHYIASVQSKREAVTAGYNEALLLDHDGFLAEGTGENLFIVKEGVVKTTPLTSVLNGITRRTVIEHLRHQGYEVLEQRFTRDELWCADEAFLTGTAAEVTPIAEVDNRSIGEGPGPITKRVQKDYNSIVRGDLPPYGKDWLTPIS